MHILLLNFVFRFTANCCLVDIIFIRWFAFNPIYVLVSFYVSYIMFYVLHLPPFRGHVYFFLQFQYEPVFSLLAPISFYCVYFICNVRYTAITKFYVVLICIYIFFCRNTFCLWLRISSPNLFLLTCRKVSCTIRISVYFSYFLFKFWFRYLNI